MEAPPRKPAYGGALKEEKKGPPDGDEEGCKKELVHKGNQLESTKAEMGEVKEENQRLKMHLRQIMKDYQTLQMKFYDIVQQNSQKPTNTDNQQETDELVCLSLGRISRDSKKDEKQKSPRHVKENDQNKEGLALKLECNFEDSKSGPIEPLPNPSSENSCEVMAKEEAGENWQEAHKSLETLRSGNDEASQQSPLKKARVSVRIRCDTPTMHDGCHWRKYGQKIAKGNPCPRSYYRCTVAQSCPVRKHVQRCAEDMSILITTYEGTHNHPLSISATAMASTTLAAVSMLAAGSSTSKQGTNSFGFYLSDNSKAKLSYLPNFSTSSSTHYPAVTLDLTSNSSTTTCLHDKISPNFLSTNKKISSTNLNFSSLESNPLPVSWGNGVLNYGTETCSKNQISPSLNFGSHSQESLYQSLLQKTSPNPPHQPLPIDIAAATNAITSDPSFQSTLVAALKSIIGTNTSGFGGATGFQVGDNFGHGLKSIEAFPTMSNFPSTTMDGNKCSSSYLERPSSTAGSQLGSLMFLQSSLPYFTTKNNSSSVDDNRDHAA